MSRGIENQEIMQILWLLTTCATMTGAISFVPARSARGIPAPAPVFPLLKIFEPYANATDIFFCIFLIPLPLSRQRSINGSFVRPKVYTVRSQRRAPFGPCFWTHKGYTYMYLLFSASQKAIHESKCVVILQNNLSFSKCLL